MSNTAETNYDFSQEPLEELPATTECNHDEILKHVDERHMAVMEVLQQHQAVLVNMAEILHFLRDTVQGFQAAIEKNPMGRMMLRRMNHD